MITYKPSGRRNVIKIRVKLILVLNEASRLADVWRSGGIPELDNRWR
jgi:hypothetical protein